MNIEMAKLTDISRLPQLSMSVMAGDILPALIL